MQRIAAIDVGSNAIRMIVGETDDAWHVKPLENVRLPVRLGQDAFTNAHLQETTIQRAVEAFLFFRKVADDLSVSKVRAVGTSAMRESKNSDILRDRILRAAGIDVEIISGEEEARLIHLAIIHAVKLDGKRAILVDIGGGSVEVTIAEDGGILSTESYNMGTVRLLSKLENKKKSTFPFPPAQPPFDLLVREYAEAARQRIDREIGRKKVNLCIGTGGNVEEMGRLRQKLFKQPSDKLISMGELQALIEKLSEMSVKERIRKLGLRPDRADVILPAAIVLQTIAREAKVQQVTIPNVGLKDGILLQLAKELEFGRDSLDTKQVWQSATRLGEKYQYDSVHANLTAKLAAQIFDQSLSLHNLGKDERFLLEVGALLHDIGHFISTIEHDKHGYYLLKANRLIGLNERQQEIIANLVRYHRRPFPSVEDGNFRALESKDRLTVLRLAALLRLVDGMDVSHTGRVRKITLVEKKKTWVIGLQGRGDFMLERWALNKRKALFEEVFGVKLEVEE
jgi:exopolyphosphatase/guanosine-5'-triphosphate,3'-diphosphate pyrophosphatase